MTKDYAALYHHPTEREAARWLALATVAKHIADGVSRDLPELGRLADACTASAGEATTVFGHLTRDNACVRLLSHAKAHAAVSAALAPISERDFGKLRYLAEEVTALHQAWERAR